MFPNSSGPNAHPEFSPLSLTRMLWKSRALIGLIWIFLCLFSAAAVWMIPPVYRAEAVILVDSQKVPERYVASTVNADVQDRLATISQQILSTGRLQKIIDNFHLYQRERASLPQEEIIETMRRDTKITLERGLGQEHTSAFRISYQGQDPATVAEVANQIGSLFIDENLRTRESHAEGTSEFIGAQLEQAKKTLTDLESQVEDYKLKHKGELPEQESSLAGELSRAQIELQVNADAIDRAGRQKALLSTSVALAESTTRALEGAAAKSAPPAAAASAESNHAAALQAELDALRLRYTEDHPDIKRLEKLVAQALQTDKTARPAGTAAAKATNSDGAGPDLLQQRERVANLRTELALAGHEQDIKTAERKQLLSRVAGMQARMDTLPVREQQLTALSRDYEIAKANYKALLNNRLSADMATDMERRQQGERFAMIDPAQPPSKPFSPDRAAWLGGACAVSLLLSVVAGVVREMKRNVLLGEWELPPDVPILGRITAIVPPAARAEEAGGV